MKTAIVHDYFTQMGGAEKVAEALYRMFPSASVFSTVAKSSCTPPGLREANVQTSWMQHLPWVDRYYRQYFPLYPLGVAGIDLRGYDLVITSSSGYAKGVRTDKNAFHVCYCHTPMRWVWRYQDYSAREGFGPGKRMILPLMINTLKLWDEHAARQPDQYVVNSIAVAERVWNAYRRHAEVIPPPIEVSRFKPSPHQDDYYLVLARLVSYKCIDLAVQACRKLNRRLIVIGDGPDRSRLEGMGGPTIQFLGRQPDHAVETLAAQCRALLFPGEEDFGMVPLEVNAAGRPVIAYAKGGALETVVEGTTGLFFRQPTVQSLADAIEDFESRTWNSIAIRRHAESFDVSVFEQRIMRLLSSSLPEFKSLHADPRPKAVA